MSLTVLGTAYVMPLTAASSKKDLGWEPSLQFEEGIGNIIQWYLDNQDYMDNVTLGDYQMCYGNIYKNR